MTRALPPSMAMDCSDYAVIYREVIEAIDRMQPGRRDLTVFVDQIYGAAGAADAGLDGPIKETRGCFLRVASLAILAVEQIDTERSRDRVKRKRRRT